jgi:hypothetical protein
LESSEDFLYCHEGGPFILLNAFVRKSLNGVSAFESAFSDGLGFPGLVENAFADGLGYAGLIVRHADQDYAVFATTLKNEQDLSIRPSDLFRNRSGPRFKEAFLVVFESPCGKKWSPNVVIKHALKK